MRSTERSPRNRALRFGLGGLVVLGGLGAWALWRKHSLAWGAGLGGAGGALLLLALLAPEGALAVRRAWMGLAGVLGWVNSRIILTVLFFAVLTPIALARRLFGSAPLDLAWRPPSRASYWKTRDEAYDDKHWEHPS